MAVAQASSPQRGGKDSHAAVRRARVGAVRIAGRGTRWQRYKTKTMKDGKSGKVVMN